METGDRVIAYTPKRDKGMYKTAWTPVLPDEHLLPNNTSYITNKTSLAQNCHYQAQTCLSLG